jgi:hypothetical protein
VTTTQIILSCFIAAAALVAAVRRGPARHQALVVLFGLLAMSPGHSDLWEFGIWVSAAYLVDLVGEDVAPGTFLAASALFYPATALGFNAWWCQFGANVCGLLALGAVLGLGGGILANHRSRRPAGVDLVGRLWYRRPA